MSEKTLTLQYVAHFSALTGCLQERCASASGTLRQLVRELDQRYPGFAAAVIDPLSGALRLNAAIYYNEAGQPPASLLNLDHPLQDGAVITFW